MRRAGVAGLVAIALMLSGAAGAWAVSDGQYDPHRQHCSTEANDTANGDTAEEGCSNFSISLWDGTDNDTVFVGLRQTPEGEFVDPTDPIVIVDPARLDPTRRFHLYFGADDNLNGGEHDGSSVIDNGPSDGGAIVANYDLATLTPWWLALLAGDSSYLLRHPLPLLDFGMGACADGICLAITTIERVAYQGGGEGSQPVADYSGKEWDPTSCGGPDDTEADCGPGGIGTWHNKDGTRTTEPGVQIFEDPDPQGSPIGPYPLPALYVGTCGVVAGGGKIAGPPNKKVTNSAGQLYIATGC